MKCANDLRVFAGIDQVYRFPMTFRLAENYPVDLYFLMDVSRTMRSYKDNLVALSDRLGQLSVSCHRSSFFITSSYNKSYEEVAKTYEDFVRVRRVMKMLRGC